VVAAQINDESGFNPSARSSAGAEGIAQFEPGTWQSLGCAGSPYNASDSLKCYVTYMKSLLKQYNGSAAAALAAYNAGSASSPAGQQYADTILAAAGTGVTVTAGPGTGSSTAAAGTAAAGSSCLIGPWLGVCVFTRSEARGLLGGTLMLAGGVVVLAGVIVLVTVLGKGTVVTAALGPAGKALTGAVGKAAG
jgi:hypothetical protein